MNTAVRRPLVTCATYPAAMMIDLLGWVARFRLAVLGTALSAAVVLEVLQRAIHDEAAWNLIVGQGFGFGFVLGRPTPFASIVRRRSSSGLGRSRSQLIRGWFSVRPVTPSSVSRG